METQSLHQIMNEMASRVDAIHPEPKDLRPSNPLSELEAFIQIDPLLASLQKDYLDAKSQRVELVALYGGEDAMVEVIMDMEDSAWCAMQTRFLELHDERELMERAQRLMRRAEEKIEDEKQREKVYEAKQFSYYLDTLAKIKEMNKPSNILEVALLFLIFKISPFNFQPNLQMRHRVAA